MTFISTQTHLATIACSEDSTLYEINEGDITIDVEGPYAPYEFDYYINSSTGYEVGSIKDLFKIKFEFKSSLAGDHKETIVLNFNNKEMIKDLDNNQLKSETTSTTIPFYYSYISPEDIEAAQTQSNASILSLLLTFGTSTFISVALGNTVEATWLLLGNIQLMSFVALFNMDLPRIFREFCKNLAVLHGEPGAIPNIFEPFIDQKDLEPFNAYFELMNFNTELLLLNAGRKILLWAIMFSLMGISFIIFDMCSEITLLGKIIRKIDTKIRYGTLIRSVSQFYLSFSLCALLNIYTISWSGSNSNVFINLSACIGMVLVIYIPIKSFNIIYKAPDISSNDFIKRYKTIIAGLKTKGPLCFQFI